MTLDIEDRIAITDLINLHGHYVDDGDLDAVDTLFTDDIVYDLTEYGGGQVVGRERLRAGTLELGDNNPVAHLVTNIVLTQISPDEVHARSKGIGMMSNGTAGSATYEDVVVRTAQGWRFRARRVIPRRVPLSGVHHQG